MYLKAVVTRHELEGGTWLKGSSGPAEVPQKGQGTGPSHKGKIAYHPTSGTDRTHIDRQAPVLAGDLRGQSSSALPEGISPQGMVHTHASASSLPLRPSTTMSLVRPVELRPPTDMQV